MKDEESFQEPIIFLKPETALLDNNQPFVYENHYVNICQRLQLVLKICKSGKNISLEDAPSYYSQITVGIDLTDKGKQTILKEKGHPWELAKAFDHSAIVGQFIPLKSAFYLEGLIPFHL